MAAVHNWLPTRVHQGLHQALQQKEKLKEQELALVLGALNLLRWADQWLWVDVLVDV